MQTDTSPLKFPQSGWLGQRLKNGARTAVSKLKGSAPPKKDRPSQSQLEALRKRFAKS